MSYTIYEIGYDMKKWNPETVDVAKIYSTIERTLTQIPRAEYARAKTSYGIGNDTTITFDIVQAEDNGLERSPMPQQTIDMLAGSMGVRVKPIQRSKNPYSGIESFAWMEVTNYKTRHDERSIKGRLWEWNLKRKLKKAGLTVTAL
ncbi:hypothetical protein C4573_00400 [Candidatus Woesearchaeota archaeon]|nr:MAG: hypothetical protein C4573_00400 [Candidatus Woesearchaeota archaeon]